MFPGEYTTAVMSGNGVAGILIFVIRLVTKFSLDSLDDGRTSAILFFGLTAFVMLVCLLSVFLLWRLDYFQHYMGERKSVSIQDTDPLLEKPTTKPEFMVVMGKVWLDAAVRSHNTPIP